MEAKVIGYWATTSILALEALVGGVVGLTNGREMVVAGTPIDDVMAHLWLPRVLCQDPRDLGGTGRYRLARAAAPAPQRMGVCRYFLQHDRRSGIARSPRR